MTSERFSEAFQKGFGYTTRYLQSRGASKDQAEEVAQAAWAKGWERLDQLREECVVGLWVNTIALNEFRRIIRRQSFYVPMVEVLGEVGVDSAAIDAATILNRCRPRDQILFEHQLQGHTTEEIATLLGASKTAIRIRLLRARRAARRQIETKPSFLEKAPRRKALRNVA
jgi:DNA-directed RNA polymerase specialized sigma24 family protein